MGARSDSDVRLYLVWVALVTAKASWSTAAEGSSATSPSGDRWLLSFAVVAVPPPLSSPPPLFLKPRAGVGGPGDETLRAPSRARGTPPPLPRNNPDFVS